MTSEYLKNEKSFSDEIKNIFRSFYRLVKEYKFDKKQQTQGLPADKINFIFHVFTEILQRYCQLVILGILGMPGYATPRWYFQPVENFHVYLQTKNQLHSSSSSGDIAKICKFLILRTLGMPHYAHLKWIDQLVERKLRCSSACQK